MVHKNIPEKNLKNNDEEKSYNISFKKKRTKSSIRFGAKLLTYLIIAAVSGAFFSRIMIDIKYGNAIKSIEEFASDDMIITDYTKVIDVINPSIVTIGNSSGIYSGESSSNTTGIILDESGNIITSYSLIKDFKEIFVKLSDDSSEPVNAKLVVKSEDIDLAIIKVKTDEELTPVKFAEDNDLFIGQGIAVLGNQQIKSPRL